MRILKQSTARDILIFMTDSSDHVTGKTGLTLTITASKAGGAFASISPTVTERSNGWYAVTLTASHTDTLGDYALHVTGTGADPSDVLMEVLAQILGDNITANVTQFGGSNGTFLNGRPETNATHWGGTAVASANVLIDGAITAAKIASDAITAAKISDGAITAAKFASGALDAVWSTGTRTLTAATNITAAIAAAVWEVATSGLTTAGTIGKLLVDNVNATISSRSSHAAADVWAVGTRTLTSVSGLGIATAAKLLSYFQSALRKDVTVDADIGGNYDDATDSLEAIRDRGDAAWVTGGGGGAGSGAYTLTVTVNDGATALQNATVRMTEGVNTFTALTNASGVAVFALDAATYAVAITKDGYQFTPTTRVVSATASQTYSMTAVTITPSPADQVTGYLTTYDENGDVEADVDVTLRIKSAPSDAGFALDSADRVATSDVNGLVEFPGMFPGARYSIWRGTEIPKNPKSFILPTDATDPTALDSFVGTP